MTTYLSPTYQKIALTANGAANGLLTVASTTNLVAGAIAFLSSDTIAPVPVYIHTIVSATTFYVKQLNITGTFNKDYPALRTSMGDYSYYNASAFLLADNAKITQPSDVGYPGITL